MFGKKLTLLVDTTLQTAEKSTDISLSDCLGNLREKWNNAHEFARIISDKTHELSQHRYDKNRVPVKSRIGDLVFGCGKRTTHFF